MSTTIDQKVVEMRFDNKQFESNVNTTMSTLDKLKAKLNLTGAAKGFDDIGRAAKNVDMSTLGRGVEQVGLKFNAMYTMADQALRNITNRVQQTAENMAKALTIDPIKTGFQEYETQINSVQTILANTKSKGSTIDDVNGALRELNEYADKTIYNFTEMTRNIGTFTAAGIDLDTSVNAIQGIANLAAVSGSTSQQASTAMYQLSQALATGTVKLMDWNSVVNAGMGGEMFQNALKETSRLLGTGADEAIKATGSFRESLREEWLTAEVLTETLKKFTTTGANEYIAEYTGLTKEAVDAETEKISKAKDTAKAIDEVAESLAKASGKSKEEIKTALEFAQNAEDAATKVKTFTQLWDVLKESAQSGWSQTWQLIVGDFEQAKSLLTPLADALTGFIGKMSKARNDVLESAFAKKFTNLVDNVKSSLKPIQQSADSVKEVVNSVKDYAKVVDEIIGGQWGNGQERWDKLTKAGYDWAHAQNLVNEKLGSSVRHTTDYKEAQNGVAESQEKTSESTTKYIAKLARMNDAQLEAAGITDKKMITSLRELAKAADQTGIPLEEFIENIDQIDGRYLFINTFKNAGDAFIDTCRAIGEAWKKIFPPKSTEEKAQALFNVLAAMHKFTRGMADAIYVDGKFTETGDNLIRTLKGIFAVIDIVTTLVGGGFKIAFKLLTSVLSYFNMDILDLTAILGDALVKFRDWFDKLFDVTKVFDVIASALKGGSDSLKKWKDALMELEGVKNLVSAIERLAEAFKSIKLGEFPQLGKVFGNLFDKILGGIKKLTGIDLSSAGGDIFNGLIKGLGAGALKVIDIITQTASNLINKFCEILGIHSPSTVFIALGGFIIAGLLTGLKEGFISVPESLQGIVDKCLAIIENIDWGAVFAIGASVAGLLFIKKVGDVLENFSAPFAGLGEIFESVSGLVDSFGKVTKAMATNIKTKALKNLAITLAILVGCVIAIVKVGGDDFTAMLKAVGIIGALAVILVLLSWAMDKLSKSSVSFEKGKGLNIEGIKSGLLTIAVAIGVLALVVKLISTLNPGQAVQGFIGLGVLMGAILGFVYLLQKLTEGDISENVSKIGGLMLKLSFALLLMVAVCKLVGKLSPGEMIKGGLFLAAMLMFIDSIAFIAKDSGEHVSKVGGMMIKLAFAMGLMVLVCKLVDLLSVGEMIKGALFAGAMNVFVKALVKATTIGGEQQIAKLGGLLIGISFSMMLMVGICKLASKLSPGEMVAGAIFALAFAVFVKLLVKATTIASTEKIAKISGTILAISIAIGILALVTMLIGLLKVEHLAKGITAVTILGILMAVMTRQLKGANDVKGSLIAMTVAIALMAVAVAALSLIDPARLAIATGCLSALMGMFALMIHSLKGSADIKQTIGTIIAMTVVVGLLAAIIWRLSKVDPQTALGNAGALSILLVAMSGAMLILSKMKTNATKALKGVLLLTAMAIPLLAFTLILKQLKSVEGLEKNVLILVGLMAAMTVLLGLLTIIGNFGLSALAGVALLTAMWVPMFAFIDIIKRLKGIKNIQKNVTILAGLMGVMTVLLGLLAIIGFGAIPALAGVLALTAMWVPMFAFIDILKRLKGIETVQANVFLLSGLMTVMTKLLGKLALIGFAAIPALAGVIALTAMWVPMFVFIDILKRVSNVELASENITLLMDMMTILTNLLTRIAPVGPLALMGVGAVQGLIILIGEVALLAAAIGALADWNDDLDDWLNDGLPLLEQLAGSIGTMIGSFASNLGDALGNTLVKMGNDISVFMMSLSTASVTASTIKGSSFDGVKSLIEALVGVALATGGMKIADLLNSIFGDDKTVMESFEEDAKAFFGALNAISESMTNFSLPEGFSSEDVSTLLGALASVAKNTFGMSLADIATFWGSGEDSAMEKFQNDGVKFFQALKAISVEMCGFEFPENFDTKSLTTLLDSLKAVAENTKDVAIADIFSKIAGDEGAMEKFQSDGVAFFTAIKDISANMCGFSFSENFDTKGLEKMFEAFSTVGEYTKGATVDDIFTFGGTTMEKFQSDGVLFFSTLSAISTEAGTISTANIDIAKSAITKIKSILSSVIGLDYSGIEEFTGIGTGGMGADGPMHDIAEAVKDFGDTVAGLNIEAVNTAIGVANKLVTFFGRLVGVDYSGVEAFTGIGTGGAGADGPAHDIAEAIKDFSNTVSGISPEAVDKSIGHANKLITLIGRLVGLDTSGIALFKPEPIGKQMQLYSNAVAAINVEAVTNSISTASKLRNFINSLSGLKTDGVASFVSAINDLSMVQVDNIVKSFGSSVPALFNIGGALIDSIASGMESKKAKVQTIASNIIKNLGHSMEAPKELFRKVGSDSIEGMAGGMLSRRQRVETSALSIIRNLINAVKSPAPKFKQIGVELITRFIQGIDSKRSGVKTVVTSFISTAISSTAIYYTNFYSAGSYLVDGFVAGISGNSYKASLQAAAMATAAKEAAEEALGINSPSKVFYQIGDYVGQGFTNALGDYNSKTYEAGSTMADYARKGLTNAISRIQSAINGDLDVQPTIRPVLDLSDVQTGAAAIDGLFANGVSVATMANVNSVSSIMRGINQNGSNNDVISAINRLGSSLANLSGDTYHIDGITYDDGSNIANAMQAIVRETRIERRR